jgi:hypothetical protein
MERAVQNVESHDVTRLSCLIIAKKVKSLHGKKQKDIPERPTLLSGLYILKIRSSRRRKYVRRSYRIVPTSVHVCAIVKSFSRSGRIRIRGKQKHARSGSESLASRQNFVRSNVTNSL